MEISNRRTLAVEKSKDSVVSCNSVILHVVIVEENIALHIRFMTRCSLNTI